MKCNVLLGKGSDSHGKEIQPQTRQTTQWKAIVVYEGAELVMKENLAIGSPDDAMTCNVGLMRVSTKLVRTSSPRQPRQGNAMKCNVLFHKDSG